MSRTIIVGDLHGCYREAMALLDKLAVTTSDRVIFLGDLVDRGPNPADCVRLAMQHECVIGNHEEKHLQQRHRADEKLTPDHLKTRQQLEDEHYDYFERLPLFIELPEYNSVVVHAGCYPGLDIHQQSQHHLLHLQHIAPPNPKSYWPSKAPDGYKFWTNYWQGPTRVIFGHSVLSKPLVTEHAVGIDTGCVFGRGLSAFVLPDQVIYTQPSRDYSNKAKTNPAFHIQNDVFAFS